MVIGCASVLDALILTCESCHASDKALGYGIAGGIALGVWFSHGLGYVYATFYSFPWIRFTFDPKILAAAVLVGAFAALEMARHSDQIESIILVNQLVYFVGLFHNNSPFRRDRSLSRP